MLNNEIYENARHEYARWLANTEDDKETYEELLALGNNEEELIDSFYTNLKFGTSGLRGIIGPGTNRINQLVIRRITQGLANYLNKNYQEPSVVIAYDSRKKSKVFAEETARVLRGNNLEVYIYPEIAPVPLLSYSITHLNCTMGIMITASHNPKIFNGYKVYNNHGYQIVGDVPRLILEEINRLDYFDEIKSKDTGIHYIGSHIPTGFVEDIKKMSLVGGRKGQLKDLKIVYTPLNGAGSRYVQRVFDEIGMRNYKVVEVQEKPDENFSTCPVPNPEKITAYNEAFKTLDKVKGDLIIATDPDCDRIGAALYNGDMKVLLTGNQLGVLIFDYMCHLKQPKKGQIVIKSIVTTPLIEKIAASYSLRVINTLTGFKYIGEIITYLEAEGRLDEFYFGLEESNGYLMSPFIRDKDGVSGAMITAEMAAFHKAQGKNLMERLYEIYDEYGLCIDKTRNYFF